MVLGPCLGCGEPTDGPRCPECSAENERAAERPTHTRRGYNAAWERLSRRARRLQRFCSDCGATEDLTVDHSPEAWARQARGLSIRLQDVEVVCRPCNSRRGRAKPHTGDSAPRGVTPGQRHAGPAGESKFSSHFPHSETLVPGGEPC